MDFILNIVVPIIVGLVCGILYAVFIKMVFNESSFIKGLLLSTILWLIVTIAFLWCINMPGGAVIRIILFITCLCLSRAILSIKLLNEN